MSIAVRKNAKLYVGPYDFSGQMNAVALSYGAKAVDATCDGDNTEVALGGLKTVKLELNGLWEPPDLEAQFFDRMGLSDQIYTMSPAAQSGSRAYFCRPNLGDYAPGAKTGDLYAYKVSAGGPAKLVRGRIILPKLARLETGLSSAFNFGAITATQKLYAALHVFAVSGDDPTLNVSVKTDSTLSFTTPATPITFSEKTAPGQDWQEAPGPVTDIYYEILFEIGGTNPSFTFAVALGIL